MGIKRTYSRRTMSMKLDEGDPPLDANKAKRTKQETPSRPKARPFSGPISVPGEDDNIEMVDVGLGRGGLLAKAHHGRSNKMGTANSQPSISGDRSEFDRWVAATRARGGAFNKGPTPGRKSTAEEKEVARADGKSVLHENDFLQPASPIALPKSKVPTVVSKPVKKVIKEPYVPKSNDVVPVPFPRKNNLGERITSNPVYAAMWDINQNSPLLRLPAEIRNRIYEYALGDRTIKIEYKTYHVEESTLPPKVKVDPIFKYSSQTIAGYRNPFRKVYPRTVVDTITRGMTLLNGVCRQLYHETAILPYKLNSWGFESHHIMFNFLWMDKRLSRAQLAAIRMLVVKDMLPQPNLLNAMRGLEYVKLVSGISVGLYKVVNDGQVRTLKRESD